LRLANYLNSFAGLLQLLQLAIIAHQTAKPRRKQNNSGRQTRNTGEKEKKPKGKGGSFQILTSAWFAKSSNDALSSITYCSALDVDLEIA